MLERADMAAVVGTDEAAERGLGGVRDDAEVEVEAFIFETFGLGILFPVAKRKAFLRSISSFSPVMRSLAGFISCSSGCTFPFNFVSPSAGLSSRENQRH